MASKGLAAMTFGALAGGLLLVGAAHAAECTNGHFTSTYDLIQAAVFEHHGCADTLCHGAAASGGLDLRKETSYQSLVDVDSGTVPGMKRVATGDKDVSLLWINLAAKTMPAAATTRRATRPATRIRAPATASATPAHCAAASPPKTRCSS